MLRDSYCLFFLKWTPVVNSRARERTLDPWLYFTVIPLHWECGVLATRPPGKLYVTFKKNLIEIVFYSQKWKISAPGHKRKVIIQKAVVLSLN